MNVMGIIFANIYDSSLGELTNKRTMASLPFAGRYRQIDFALSNMANFGIRRIGIISQHNYRSLMNHIGSGEEWDLDLQEGGLEFLTPYSQGTSLNFRGKLDALNSVLDYLDQDVTEDYVVLADPSVLYNMDMQTVLDAHIASGKDITVVAKADVANGKKQLDLAVKLTASGEIADMAVDYVAPEGYLASMGLFIIARDLLVHHIRESVARNLYRLERDFLLRGYQEGLLSVNIFEFSGVTLFTESTQEYYDANMAVLDSQVRTDLFRSNHPIYTKVRDQVPSYYGETCRIENCVLADGCVLNGTARNSVLFRHVTIGEGTTIDNCLIMNDTVIGENCELKYVILDKDVCIRPGTRLIGTKASPVILERGETV